VKVLRATNLSCVSAVRRVSFLCTTIISMTDHLFRGLEERWVYGGCVGIAILSLSLDMLPISPAWMHWFHRSVQSSHLGRFPHSLSIVDETGLGDGVPTGKKVSMVGTSEAGKFIGFSPNTVLNFHSSETSLLDWSTSIISNHLLSTEIWNLYVLQSI